MVWYSACPFQLVTALTEILRCLKKQKDRLAARIDRERIAQDIAVLGSQGASQR